MDILKLNLLIVLSALCVHLGCKPAPLSSTSDIIVDANSRFVADMNFAPNETHGTLSVQSKNNGTKFLTIDACIGEKSPCLQGSARTFRLIKSPKVTGTFDFPVKVSLLMNASIQIRAILADGKEIRETFKITNDWTKTEAKKILDRGQRGLGLTQNTDFMMYLNSLLSAFSTGQPTQGYFPAQPLQYPNMPQQPLGNNPYIPIPQQTLGNSQYLPNANSQQIIPQAPNGATSGPSLNVGRYYNQGATNYCWGYSMFHALRDYYGSGRDNSADGARWREALASIDSADGISNFMRSNFPNAGGMPPEFLSTFTNKHGLSANGWSRGNGTQSIVGPLGQGKPTPLCSPDGVKKHCVAAVAISGDTVTIADSGGGHTYQESLSSLQSKSYTWTLLPQ